MTATVTVARLPEVSAEVTRSVTRVAANLAAARLPSAPQTLGSEATIRPLAGVREGAGEAVDSNQVSYPFIRPPAPPHPTPALSSYLYELPSDVHFHMFSWQNHLQANFKFSFGPLRFSLSRRAASAPLVELQPGPSCWTCG